MSEQSKNAISEQGLADLRAELEELEGPARRAMAARIKAARELGDLSENAEYHVAKEDQAHLETRILRMRARLQNAEVVDVDATADAFAFGRTAEVVDGASGKSHTWTLVGATEADLPSGKLSVEAPIGAALLNAAVGEEVEVETPAGVKTYTVKKLV